MISRAKGMVLLARVEEAREVRHRTELLTAEQAHDAAAAGAEQATRNYLRACEQRRAVLRQRYQALLGVRSIIDVQRLRDIEQTLAAHRAAAEQARDIAESSAKQALLVSEQAREALQEVSLRHIRRSRMAELQQQAETRAALMAEEESLSDELMERFRGMPT